MKLICIKDAEDNTLTEGKIYEGTLYDHWLLGYMFITFNDQLEVKTYNVQEYFEPLKSSIDK